MMDETGNSPRSLMRVVGLFESLSAAPQGLPLMDISAALEAPKSSLLSLLRPLVARGYLQHDGVRYSLGPQAFRLATGMLTAQRTHDQVRSAMERLAERTGESVFLTAIDREAGLVTYVEVIASSAPVRYVVPAGSTRPLYSSAAGRVLLAFQDPEWLEAYLKRTPLKAITPRSVTGITALRKILAEVRREAVAVTVGETIQGAAGCAAPIVAADGSVSAALLVGAPADRFERSLKRIVAAVKEAAAAASPGVPRLVITTASPLGNSAAASRGKRPFPPALRAR
ncbi:IclR family transcriptional regulator [Dankookia rubra]|nr:IclR family transcriptional regulator [Dankookia rubra]